MFEDIYSLVWLILGLPLAGFLVQLLFGGAVVRALGPANGKKVMGWLAVLPVALSFLIGLVITNQLMNVPAPYRIVERTVFDWIHIQSLSIPFEVRVDPLSMTMVLVVTGIGALIHLYATGYMAEEKDYTRFFTYMNLFIAFMLTLVLGGNLAMLFIGWEGVGLCSYLLIGFWFKDLANSRAANKAFIVNRIGDWGLTLGMFLAVMLVAGNLDELKVPNGQFLSYSVLLSEEVLWIFKSQPVITTIIALLLFVGAMGKSAQFPLYLWLPDAMAGPTPVSALIHAATMVTAGVFLLNRMAPVFELAPIACAVVAGIGAFTALFAALVAFGQTDIKKVLAYSTVSQLGFMFIACGVGAFWVGMFHVVTHAFFKALLFLGSGAVIHAMAHEQDMRRYGNLWKYLPVTAWTMIIGWLAIAGVPPLAGFWSKEAILGNALGNGFAVAGGVNVGVITGWIGLAVAVLTAAYMTRMTLLTFGVPFRNNEERWRVADGPAHGHNDHAHAHAHEAHDSHSHGEDVHGFFYSDDEMAVRASSEVHEHHHALEPDHKPHEVPASMAFPLVVLALLSVVGGYLMHNQEALKHWIAPTWPTAIPKDLVTGHPHGIVGQSLLWMSIAAALAGIFYGFAVYSKGLPSKEGWDLSKWNPFRKAAGAQFGFDAAMVDASVEGGGALAVSTWKGIDAGLIDNFFVNGSGFVAGKLGGLLRKIQTGYVRGYALLMLLGGVGLLGYLAYAAMRMGGQ